MDVKTLCLGLLSRRPACGYELKKEFEALFRHFFPAGYGSIYPALAGLAADGLVDCEAVAQTGRPDRKVYRITATGRAAFIKALRETSPQHKLRSEFLAMVYFAEMMPADRLQAVLAERVADLHHTVAHIRELEAQQHGPDSPGARFVAGFGAAVAKAAADYIQAHGDALLAEVAHPDAPRPGRRQARRPAAAGRLETRP